MPKLDRLAEAHARTVQEIRDEMARSLGRAGEQLNALVEELERLRLAGDPAAHDAVLAKARQKKWELTVQREAMGLRRHEDLDRLWPLPAPLLPRPPAR